MWKKVLPKRRCFGIGGEPFQTPYLPVPTNDAIR